MTALITGASGGIGEELARVFAAHGHDLVVVARRLDKLESLASQLRDSDNVAVTPIAADLGDPAGPKRVYEEVRTAGIDVDILVNNAGVLADGSFLDVPLDEHRQIIAVNISALMELSHLFGQKMRDRGEGRILNVCSTSAFQPVPDLGPYAASKAFVLSLSQAMSIENAGTGVTVTALCPGFTATDMIAKEGGGHMNLPFVPVLTAKQVASEGYDALMKGKPVHINGRANQIVEAFVTRQPRWITHRVSRALRHRGL